MDPLIPSVSIWGKSFTHKFLKNLVFLEGEEEGEFPLKPYQVTRMPVPQNLKII